MITSLRARSTFSLSILIALTLISLSSGSFAQSPELQKSEALDRQMVEHIPAKLTPGKKKVEDAYAFQRRLLRGLETIDSVIKNWARTARDPEVRKDHDALATAYGCEGLMEIERDSNVRADSLLKLAMPLFKYKDSKSYFLVALAELESKQSFYDRSFDFYTEILTGFDSLDALEDISYYAESGYAPYAYGIDAALHIAQFGASIPAMKDRAIVELKRASEKHSLDALGLMAFDGLKHIDSTNAETYSFQIEQLCSRKPKLRKALDKYEKQFSELKQ